jgi:hypothetical protein
MMLTGRSGSQLGAKAGSENQTADRGVQPEAGQHGEQGEEELLQYEGGGPMEQGG